MNLKGYRFPRDIILQSVHAYLPDVLLRIDDHPNRLIDELLPDQWVAPAAA